MLTKIDTSMLWNLIATTYLFRKSIQDITARPNAKSEKSTKMSKKAKMSSQNSKMKRNISKTTKKTNKARK